MDNEILREFVELANRLNFTETARMLNIAQPTLSKHIIAFEKKLKLSLFDRSGGGLRLTKTGAELLPLAYQAIEAQDRFFDRAKELKSSPPQRLSVGGFTNDESVTELLGMLIAVLEPTYGSSFLEVMTNNHRSTWDMLEAHAVDIAFDYMSPEEFGEDSVVEAVPVKYLPWVALVRKDHPLAQNDSLTLDDLRDCTLIKAEGAHVSSAWRYIERACGKRGFAPKASRIYSMRTADLLTVVASMGDGVFILGTNFAHRVGAAVAPFCVQIPISDEDALFPLSALYRVDNPSELVNEAVDVIRARAEKLRRTGVAE